MVHNLDPFLWQISGEFGIRWYGLAYLAGFICAYLVINKLASTSRAQIPVRLVSDFITFGALGVMIGGRLGYVFFYSPDLITKFKTEFPYWGVLAVNEGGMASHGGMIGLVIACLLFARANKVSALHLFDLVSLTGPIGIFFGRIANFINGELVGRVCDPDFPLGVKFPSDINLWPTQNPEKLKDLTVVIEKLNVSREQWLGWVDQFRFQSQARDGVYNTLSQIIHAIQDGNLAVQEALAPLLTARHPSQLYAALGEGLILFMCLAIIWYKPRKPGIIGASFVIIYALVRIIDEHFRMPDAHIGYEILGLTRGQLLSSAMLLIGISMLVFWGRRHTTAIGGWGKPYN